MNAVRLSRVLWILLLGSSVALPAAGQGSQADRPYQPVAVTFDPNGLTLLDAVKLTLQHEPNIKLRDAEAAYRAGVLRQETGRFDMVLRATLEFEHRQDELRESQKEQERKYRADLDAAIPQVEALAASLQTAISNLNNPTLINNPRTTDLTTGVVNTDIKNELGILQSQLRLLDDLIASNPSVRASLLDLRSKTVTQAIGRFTGEWNEIRDEPGKLRQRRADLGDAPEEQFNRRVSGRVDLTKPLRSGILFAPYADITFTKANYVGKASTDPAKGGLGVKDLYRGELGFEVLVPLQRGLGSESVAAGERAARQDLEAARLTLLHEKSASVLNTVLAYWDARAAAEQVEVARRSVELQADLTRLIQALIKAKERARADESRVLASSADAQARLEAAERRLGEARVNLARVMGVALADAASIPLASDPFPRPPDSLSVEDAGLASLIALATGQRFDRQAAFRTEDAERIIARGAVLDTRKQVNLDSFLWGSSVNEESFDVGSWSFRSWSTALDVEIPFGNNQRQGYADQRAASLRQATINALDLERTIALGVVRLARALRSATERLRHAEEAVRNYDQTIKDEQAKLKLGDSTLVDTILTEQQATAARLALVAAQQEYAALVARLRYEAGLLVRDAGGDSAVTLDSLTGIPAALTAAARR